MDFFDRVKNEIKKKNLTIEGFLQTICNGKISRDVYNGWKRHNNLPRLDVAIEIARALDVSVYYLYDGKDINFTQSEMTLFYNAKKYSDIIDYLEEIDSTSKEMIRIMLCSIAEHSQIKKKKS